MNSKKVKIMMLGESGVGKSCLLTRFVDNTYDQQISTTLGVEFRKKNFIIKDTSVDVQVWDTAGQERFRTITPIYYKNVQGVIFVYDITCEKSFESINYWMKNLNEHGNEKTITALIGSKIDLQDKRVVPRDKGFNFAQNNNMQFWETSAKININVQDVFKQITENIIDQGDIVQDEQIVKIDEKPHQNTKNNCKMCS